MPKETQAAALKRILAAQGWEIYSDERGLAMGHLDALIAENSDLRVQCNPNTKPAEPGLPPCPFCDCTNLYTTSMPRFPGLPQEWDGGVAYAIACGACAATGGWGKSIGGARHTWNMRANVWQKRCEKIAAFLKPSVESHVKTPNHCNLCEINALATGTEDTSEKAP
jgi:hypothetical protein